VLGSGERGMRSSPLFEFRAAVGAFATKKRTPRRSRIRTQKAQMIGSRAAYFAFYLMACDREKPLDQAIGGIRPRSAVRAPPREPPSRGGTCSYSPRSFGSHSGRTVCCSSFGWGGSVVNVTVAAGERFRPPRNAGTRAPLPVPRSGALKTSRRRKQGPRFFAALGGGGGGGGLFPAQRGWVLEVSEWGGGQWAEGPPAWKTIGSRVARKKFAWTHGGQGGPSPLARLDSIKTVVNSFPFPKARKRHPRRSGDGSRSQFQGSDAGTEIFRIGAPHGLPLSGALW